MRAEKQLLLDEINEHMDQSNGFLMTKYQSLNPKDSGTFRADLEKVGAILEVVKKRIFIKALEQKGIQISEKLSGHIGLIFTKEDPIGAAKAVVDFDAKGENVELVGGQIEGQMIDKEEAKRLSKLPGKDQLRSMFVGLLQAPMQQVVGIMNSHLAGFLHCLDQKIKQNK